MGRGMGVWVDEWGHVKSMWNKSGTNENILIRDSFLQANRFYVY